MYVMLGLFRHQIFVESPSPYQRFSVQMAPGGSKQMTQNEEEDHQQTHGTIQPRHR